MNTKVSEKIASYNLSKLASETQFTLRPVKKISPESYVHSFFRMMEGREYTVKNWAKKIAVSTQTLVSKQGVLKKLSYRHTEFANKLLREIITNEVEKVGGAEEMFDETLFNVFNKILLEDSSCLSMPRNLAEKFKGSFSKTKKAATAKVQLRVDLRTGRYENIDIGSFTDSDGLYAWAILLSLKPNDLVIRDLGYWNIGIFERISASGAYYLSLLKKNVSLFDNKNNRLCLVETLKQADKDKRTVVDISVKMGAKNKAQTRLVALKLPASQAKKRRQEALKDRDKRKNTNGSDYQYLCGWEIFVTNVEQDVWTPEQVSKAYGFRWRIEIIFKCWKSKLGIAKIFEKTEMSHPHALIALTLALAWITLSFLDNYLHYSREVYKKKGVFISMMEFANFYIQYFEEIMHWKEEMIIEFVAYYCAYDKRKGRLNHMEKHMGFS